MLFVEDSNDDRDLVLLQLRRSGFEVQWKQVASGDALREALAEKWDLVLCDYHMPGFGALFALEIVQQMGIDVPFIIVSGILGEEAAVTAMKAGAHDFFPKSKLTRLGAAIEREIKEAGLREAKRQSEREKDRLFVELQRALRVRDDFLVLASHEFRTPLTVLRLQLAGLLRARGEGSAKPGTPQDERRRLQALERQLERLSLMIERLVDVTMLSSEPLRLVREQTDLRELVVDVMERSREWIDGARCQLKLNAAQPVEGWWDRIRLESVIENLLSNALKFGAGKPITVTVERVDQTARLTVRDEGIGMSLDEQERLFTKFARSVPTQNYGGFGFGLWIVDQLVRVHRGVVRVNSSKGEGATFTVELPVGAPAQA
jgi:signal transduction histidine kinase